MQAYSNISRKAFGVQFDKKKIMVDKGTKKKVTRVAAGETNDGVAARGARPFVPTAESKAKSAKLRVIAALLWVLAIAVEVVAIILLKRPPVNTILLGCLIVGDLILAVIGSLLWKKSNRLDPASEKDKFRFFVQNQLGAIIAVIAFLPLVIFIFTDKNLQGKQKGILGAAAVVALLIAGIVGIDFNPSSVEQYAEQTNEIEQLTGANSVYWTKSGNRYHIYSDCQHINTNRTDEIFNGTVAQARELKNITELCKTCKNRCEKAKGESLGVAGEAVLPLEEPAGEATSRE